MNQQDEELFKRTLALTERQGWNFAIAAEMCERIKLDWHVYVMKFILGITFLLALYGALK